MALSCWSDEAYANDHKWRNEEENMPMTTVNTTRDIPIHG
jgi:hypothetical protein